MILHYLINIFWKIYLLEHWNILCDKKLCKELDINIEELINGEKDKSEEAKEKAIISTINETNKVKKNSKKLLIVLSTIFVIIVCGLIYYNSNLKVNLVND